MVDNTRESGRGPPQAYIDMFTCFVLVFLFKYQKILELLNDYPNYHAEVFSGSTSPQTILYALPRQESVKEVRILCGRGKLTANEPKSYAIRGSDAGRTEDGLMAGRTDRWKDGWAEDQVDERMEQWCSLRSLWTDRRTESDG